MSPQPVPNDALAASAGLRRPTNGLLRLLAPLLTAAFVLWLIGDAATHALRYERDAVLHGELWRLVTAHLVHLGATHLALNAVGVLLVAALVGREESTVTWAGLASVVALGVGIGLLIGSPRVGWYAGFSGVGHGLLAAGSVALAWRHRTLGVVCAVALGVKLAWDPFTASTSAHSALVGGATIADAHLYGAATGALAAALLQALRRSRRSRGV